ncbi:MAG TPA: hypothetical protein VFM63_11890, partial [Pyrinomonadaceae bacterium]|nr:hypothetical protein [Pyrinomonadaceae bacterium]
MHAAIQQLNSQRTPPKENARFNEYKGVMHVHSFLGGHSSGTFSEIIAAAKANQLRFVIMTEHLEQEFDTASMTLRGEHAGTLFVNGSEVSAENGDRTLELPGRVRLSPEEEAIVSRRSQIDFPVTIVAYPEEFKEWEKYGLSGVEVFNVYTNARRINPVVAFFDVLWSRRSYPDLLFALYYERPNESLKLWDQALTHSRLTATAGNDAHANIGVSLRDSSGKTLAGIQLDPYEVSFQLVRMHVLIEQDKRLNQENLLEAIEAGHCFIGFDFLVDSSGFSFAAESQSEQKIQGDEITLTADTRLVIETPVSSRIKLFKDGNVVLDETGVTARTFPVSERGVYRVEVYLPQLGSLAAEKPW